jgi:integrase/recombinase XerD
MSTNTIQNTYTKTLPKVYFEPGVHRGNNVIFIKFEKNYELIIRVKKLVGVKWSNTKTMWYVPDNASYRQQFKLAPIQLHNNCPTEIHTNNIPAWELFVKLIQQKGYSPNTLRTYTNEFSFFLKTLKGTSAESLNTDRINDYLHYCITTLKLSEGQVHSRINALKFYYEKVLNRSKIELKLTRPKKPLALPKALSFQDVQAILNATENNKHYFILALTYGTGIRLSEIVNIKLSHIDINRKTIFLERAKGKKDRVVNFPASLESFYTLYLLQYKPKIYLFEGQFGGQYSSRSIQSVFFDAKTRAKVITPGGIHGFRHSYATHLHELGTDITLIQKLLGHNDIKTTLIYTQISKKEISQVSSPLDKLIRTR